MATTCLLNNVQGVVQPCALKLADEVCSRSAADCYTCVEKHKHAFEEECEDADPVQNAWRDEPFCSTAAPGGRYGLDEYFTPQFRKLMWEGIKPNLRRIRQHIKFDPRKFSGVCLATEPPAVLHSS
jgi:hypothetical protein